MRERESRREWDVEAVPAPGVEERSDEAPGAGAPAASERAPLPNRVLDLALQAGDQENPLCIKVL